MEDASQLLSKIELDDYTITEVRNGWETVEKRLGGPREAGDFVFKLLKDAVPRTESMLKRSSTVWHLLDGLMQALSDPDLMQKRMEYIALRHMNADITTADVEVFKGILLEVCAKKLGGLMTPEFQFGLGQIVTAVGISLANTHAHYAQRLRLLTGCWKEVNATEDDAAEEQEEKPQDSDSPDEASPIEHAEKKDHDLSSMEKGEEDRHTKWNDNGNMNIPKTFAAMARFNASVMGIGDRMWFADLLYSMESLVPHIGNVDRVQEECDVLALTLAHYDKVNLGEFRSVMFASLRSLLPTAWSLDHENAWSWFWTCVEKKVELIRQLPVRNQQCLRTFLSRMDEDALATFKLKVFDTFFASCEESQLYLRAANKRLQYIMGRILTIMSDVYTKTHKAVIAISALGLLHAGHGVPEDLVRPFVQAFMCSIKEAVPDESIHDGLWWTLDLIGRIFIRTLSEGSTPVIIAINKNNTKVLNTAVSNAPRGQREVILLRVQVGTESMSPLVWAVEKGALESAGAILKDLLTMRADRGRYYYGMEAIFSRHPDIIPLLCNKAPSLLVTLLDELIWRSKNVRQGMRRVNYYISSMLVGDEGQLTTSLLDLIKHGDPEIVCHPAAVFQADLLWARLCCLPWAATKVWFCVTLGMFVVAEQHGIITLDVRSQQRYAIIACRACLYFFSLGQLLVKHAVQSWRALRAKQTRRFIWRCHLPSYLLQSGQEMTEVILLILLLCMLCCEPVLHCLSASNELLVDCCEYGEWYCSINNFYNRLAAFPMLLYFLLASELVHLHVQLSVFSVICASLWWEFMLYLAVLIFFAATFAAGVACLPQSGGAESAQMRDFNSMPAAFESMLGMAFNTYGSGNFEEISTAGEPMLKWFVMAFAACWHVYLMNLMVAQLCQRYNDIFHNARGNARLTRGIIIYETSMPLISKHRWGRFVESLRLEEACELDEGDNGPRGAVPTLESPYEYLQYPAVELDRVQRYGGLANPELPWPNLEEALDDSAVGRLERLTKAKFEEMDRLMVDMAVKLGVRSASLSGGAGDTTGFSSAHGSTHRDNGESSHVLDGAAKDAEEELSVTELNEGTLNELPQDGELTEEGELLNETPYGIKQSNQSPFSVHG
eukprot:CAMPEP_0181424432 /NCGR_PEP_ID=MMETSP1110-20121109/14641_1 /TAXON_ID=174948 /ORGANISM="Symbiodinium sp., Strain CCMP421" /LENGTH=1118 /DNA_ID=CAMNT_0023547589 /DNA_START=68 /DNA_END=3424 /DNA_ORIENTATION=-